MKKGLENPSSYVPRSRVVNRIADHFVSTLLNLTGEDLGAARRVSGYSTVFCDISTSGRSYDICTSCKIQTPDGGVEEVAEAIAFIPSTFYDCWKTRPAVRKMLQEKIRQTYPATS